MKTTSTKTAIAVYTVLFVISVSRQFIQCNNSSVSQTPKTVVEKKVATTVNKNKMPVEGKQAFRFETFYEVYWTDALQLNNAKAGQKIVGFGAGLFPCAILGIGLKQNCPLNFLKPWNSLHNSGHLLYHSHFPGFSMLIPAL